MTSMPWRRAWALAVVPCAALLGASCSPSSGGNEECQGSACPDTLRDRTPPQVTSLVPADGATNVWSRDPIVVTFSEPIDPASITEESLVLSDQFASPVEHVAALSPDHKTLTVTTVGLPAVPNVLHAALGPLRDRAGNTLAGWPVTWQWELPDWQDLANPVSRLFRYGLFASIALDGSGNPRVASWMPFSTYGYFGVDRWSGAGWARMHLPSHLDVGYWGVLDGDADGRLALIFDLRGEPTLLHATIWDGNAWSEPTLLTIDPTVYSNSPAVRLGENGTAVAAWNEAGVVQVKRWDGTVWTRLGGEPVASGGQLDVSFDADGSPRVTVLGSGAGTSATYGETTGTWTTTASFTAPSGTQLIRANAAGELYAVALDSTASPAQLRVFLRFPDGYLWFPAGAALNATLTEKPSSPDLAFDDAGRPVVAWAEGYGVYVARWDGGDWRRMGSNLDDVLDDQRQGAVDVVTGAGDQVAVLWLVYNPQLGGYEARVMAKRYNR